MSEGKPVNAAEDVRRALRHGPKTMAEIAEFCGCPTPAVYNTVKRLVLAEMVDADRNQSPRVYSLAREPIPPGARNKKGLIEGTRDAETAAADSIDESFVPADPDPDLNAWYLRTRDCPRCSRSSGLRRLCSACRASMPAARPGVKHNVRQAQISVGRKFSPMSR